MKYLIPLSLCMIAASCQQNHESTEVAEITEVVTTAPAAPIAEAPQLINSVIRINSTSQSWNAGQPWEKTPTSHLRSLGAIVAPGQVLTTGEMVADATYLELESPDGSKTAQAEIVAVDYEANIALLTVKSDDVGGRNQMYKNIVDGDHEISAGMPESFNVLVKEIRSLAINIELEGQ